MNAPSSPSAFPPAIRRKTERTTAVGETRSAHAPGPVTLLLTERPGAGELKYLLLSAMESEGLACIDAAAVEKLPMPALQVILSAAATLQERGLELAVKNATFIVATSLEALGFSSDLCLLRESGRPAKAAPLAATRVIAVTIRSHEDCFERAIDIRNILTGLEGFGSLAVRTSLARLPQLDILDSGLCFLDFDIALKTPVGIARIDDYLALQLGRGHYSLASGVSDAAFPPPREDEREDVYWHTPHTFRRRAPVKA
jgi:hypothetical protein